MLCFNLKIATIFRTYRDTDPVRDRSQSLFTPPPRAPHRDIGALRVLQRRASSVIHRAAVVERTSATELISRRGVFSRRHYGSVDQVITSATELISRRGVFSRRHYGSVDQGRLKTVRQTNHLQNANYLQEKGFVK
uniref:Uncharacterized protein n=1 Tax=Anopheles culicifacies TaxID=139723 RepID=A0A182M4U3_9DIPT